MITELAVAVPNNEADRGWLLPEVNQAFVKATGIAHTWRHEGTTLELALRAAREIRDRRFIQAVIVVTQTPDQGCPAMACKIASELGLSSEIPVFDVNQACSGFVYGLWLAYQAVFSHDKITPGGSTLLVVVDRLRMQTGQSPVNSFIFSDAAAAIVVRGNQWKPFSFFNDSSGSDKLWGSREGFLKMDGGAVFDFVTRNVPRLIREYQASHGKSDVLAQHQANKPMMSIVHSRSEFDGPCLDVVGEYGNMSMVSIPMALAAREQQVLGKDVLLCGYGAGWSAALTSIRWSPNRVSSVVRF